MAIHNFESTMGALPWHQGQLSVVPAGTVNYRQSGVLLLLPYLEQAALYAKIEATDGDKDPWNNFVNQTQRIPGLLCPSDPAPIPDSNTTQQTNYMFCLGDSAWVIPSTRFNLRGNAVCSLLPRPLLYLGCVPDLNLKILLMVLVTPWQWLNAEGPQVAVPEI
ncbi:MAG: DUF1559 domain-containing protein [Planctomycetota bacterium]|nr:DUF1559 domain-containing protein [Planctomycetota bacterium]